MSLETGSKLGPYEILAPLGAGGMGEVYRARDTRLSREVAIKVLPGSLAGDPDSRARFEREIRAVAALSHPNIVALHDFGAHLEGLYAVLELLVGETLRARLATGALPASRAAEFAAQIAHGLASAHEKGVVHRDLKPENLFITRDERIKILDFGLARLDPAASTSSGSVAATLDVATRAGTVFGTVGYMSPEQVRGMAADARSDVFALGAVFHEMLSGQRAFAGQTAAEIQTAILREDPPDLTTSSPALPRALERIVRRCLEKRPEARFQSALDLAFAIEAVSASSAGESGAAPASAPPPRPLRFRRLTFRVGRVSSARFGVDGHSVIYGAAWEGRPMELFTSRPESPESRSLGLPSADLFALSSSGDMALSAFHHNAVWYMPTGTLARASLAGGMRPIMEHVTSADWAPDGKQLAVAHLEGGRCRLEFPPGRVLFEILGWIDHVRISPDGSHIAFAEHPLLGDSAGAVSVIDRAGQVQRLTPMHASVNGVAWSRRGDEIWFSGISETLECGVWGVSASGRHRAVHTSMGRIKLHDIASNGNVLVTRQAINNGVRMVRGAEPEQDLSWFDGSVVSDLSADAEWLLTTECCEAENPLYAVYLRRTDGSAAIRLGDGVGRRLSPDGKWALALSLLQTPELMLYPTGLGMARTLEEPGIESLMWAGWHPDGRHVFCVGIGSDGRRRLSRRDLEGGAPEILFEGNLECDRFVGLAISPDGARIVVCLSDRGWHQLQVEDRTLHPLPGLQAGDLPVRFDASGRILYISRTLDTPPRIDRLEMDTGERRTHRTLRPTDPAGMFYLGRAIPSEDGESYAYSYARELSELYLVEGLE